MSFSCITHDVRVARKPHTCWACGGVIGCGESYVDQRCADDGAAYTIRHHLICWYIFDGDEDQSWESGCELLLQVLSRLCPILGAST